MYIFLRIGYVIIVYSTTNLNLLERGGIKLSLHIEDKVRSKESIRIKKKTKNFNDDEERGYLEGYADAVLFLNHYSLQIGVKNGIR